MTKHSRPADQKRPKWKKKWYPLDVFLVSSHAHMGHSSSMELMKYLSTQPAVRSYGMVSNDVFERYDIQCIKLIKEGKINTLFIDSGNVDDRGWFDSADLFDEIKKINPNLVNVLYTGPEYRRLFLEKHPKFSHYFYYFYSLGGDLPLYFMKEENNLDRIIDKCQFWHNTRYEYDVAVSFAGEDRRHAEDIATQLKAEGARIFYDRFEQADLLRKNLYEFLYEVYSKRCRYFILLASKYYEEKLWTSHERRAAQERAFKDRGSDFILPVRLDDMPITALSDLIAYLKIKDGLDNVVDLITKKLWIVDRDRQNGYIGNRLY